jgi:hypothetical protein
VKIKILNAKALGLVGNRQGEVYDCVKQGPSYRLTGPLHYVVISDSSLAAQHAEIVVDQEDPPATIASYGATPMTGSRARASLFFSGGVANGLMLDTPDTPLPGDEFVVSQGASYRYIVLHFDLSSLRWILVPRP